VEPVKIPVIWTAMVIDIPVQITLAQIIQKPTKTHFPDKSMAAYKVVFQVIRTRI
jgi:hypothetical protein